MSSEVIFQAIAGFRLVTADLERLTSFYRAIGFVTGDTAPIATSEMIALGLAGAGLRRPMTLGGSRIDLDSFDERGSCYPEGATTCDLVFQHLALVTDDAHATWQRAREAGATPITRGDPLTLPVSSGGVTAMKFRDPDGHPLELLSFPRGAYPSRRGKGATGIDHSAISIADIAASQRFYADRGLATGERTLNQGPAQAALDDLDGVEVDVLSMNPALKTPHIELLDYRHPAGRPYGAMAV